LTEPLPDRADDLELELRRIAAVVAVGFAVDGNRLVVELALAEGTTGAQAANAQERAELLARGCADDVVVRLQTLVAPTAVDLP
jgi:hypothetical protein